MKKFTLFLIVLIIINLFFSLKVNGQEVESIQKTEVTEKSKEDKSVSKALKEKTKGYRCRRRSVVGSHKKVKVCTTKAQRKREKRTAEDAMKKRLDLGNELIRGPRN